MADPTAQLVPEAADRPPAADQAEPYTDGVWWVDLAVVGDGAGGNANTAVAEVTAEAVGAPDLGTPLRALTTYLADRRALLCLDNAEHLLDAVAGVVETVLRSCPAVTVLATSREPLGVPGEAVLAVPPLSDEDALALFVDRARLAQPSFVLDEAAETAVRSIATHLDGIPLALELAAAWVRTLTPRQIEAGLDDRFALLVRGPAARSGGSARSRGRSTGATRCSTTSSARYSGGSPSSRAGSECRRYGSCVPEGRCRKRRCCPRWGGSSTSRWSLPTNTVASCATGCWRRSGRMRLPAWRRRGGAPGAGPAPGLVSTVRRGRRGGS
ncbi:hypothetical protein ACFQ9X_37915 [Catenulispora yoronensis]